MILTRDNQIGIIDFNRLDFGDPWEEFNRIIWCIEASPPFASGRINGYFNGTIPGDFFDLMALYIATNLLASLPWAIPFGQKQIDIMIDQCDRTLKPYDNFNTTIPDWYQAEPHPN